MVGWEVFESGNIDEAIFGVTEALRVVPASRVSTAVTQGSSNLTYSITHDVTVDTEIRSREENRKGEIRTPTKMLRTWQTSVGQLDQRDSNTYLMREKWALRPSEVSPSKQT
jgi:hypothetical protein